MSGKGSRPRPFSVSQDTFSQNWDAIFKKDKDMSGTPCGCGRSPTGKCIGWHKLSQEEFKKKLEEHQSKQIDTTQKDK